jgi:hypothetical protein
MAGADGRPFLARVRDVLAVRVQASSLRQVAREVRATPSGLQYFLDGGDPQERTRRKLEEWYLWTEAGLEPSAGDELEAVALVVLVRGLPPGHRSAAIEAAVRSLERSYAAAELPVPEWLSAMRARLGDTTADER